VDADGVVWPRVAGAISWHSIVLSVILPSWHWVAGFILVAWIGVAVGWSQHWIASSQPNYNEGPGGALGVTFFQGTTMALVIGSVIYALSLVWWTRKDATK
jgi:hypothetical protein